MTFKLIDHEEHQGYTLQIDIGKTNISIADLNEIMFDKNILTEVKHKSVIVTGKAPVFIYMFAVLQLLHAGAESIYVKQAQSCPVKIFPLKYSDKSNEYSITTFQMFENFSLWYFNCSSSTPLDEKYLSDILGIIPTPANTSNGIVISGKLPVWLAAAAAIAANLNNWGNVLCDVPQFGGEISVYPQMVINHLLDRNTQNGIVLGIAGDPNSGKSVFSKLLQDAGVANNEKIWCYDCDYAAGTPYWYLNMLQQGAEDEAKNLRESHKRKWIPGAEEQLAVELKNIAKEYNIVIADLPGGIHNSDFIQRIPDGRDALMKAIDYFIIIAREKDDCDTGLAWMEDLKKIGKSDKIILTLYSENPDSESMLDFRDDKWRISGLSRTAAGISADIYNKVWDLVCSKLKAQGIPWEFLTGNTKSL